MATKPALADVRAVVFDMDGTLTISTLDFAAIRMECGIPADQPILEHLDQAQEDERAHIWDILERHERRAAEECQLRPSTQSVLRELAERSIRTALVTRNSAECVRIVLERFGLDFEYCLSREHSRPKPAPDAVLAVAERFAIAPAQILVVGDYVFDVLSGVAAGAHTAFIRTPEKDIEPPREAEFIIDDLSELLDLIPCKMERLRPC